MFTSIKMITDGKPMHETEVVLTWIIKFSSGDFGYATGAFHVVTAFLAVLQFKAMRKTANQFTV